MSSSVAPEAVELAAEVLAGLPAEVAAALSKWATDSRYADDRAELAALLARVRAGEAGATEELEDAFAGPLPIGTGGRRGAVGAGPNRMNLTLVRETAQGLADLVHAEGVSREVAICYDTRTHSQHFAHAVADQLAACGLDVLLVDAPRPTPQLAYLVRTRGCAAGVVISASHNPPGDNGIKVYGPDGAQVLGARDRALMEAITRAMDEPLRSAGADRGRVEIVGDAEGLAAVDRPYQEFVLAQGVLTERPAGPPPKVVFTPLHGVGHTAVLPVLARAGIDVQVVEAQLPDGGRFGTVASANPEAPESLTMAIAQAEAVGADLVIATDPDADRLGVAARTRGGAIEFIDGNRTGVLMLDHVLQHARLPERGWVLSTIVTTPLVATIARAAGVDVVDDLLVGFKHHAGMLAEQPERPLVFATEESHGYLRGNDVHDKDGAIAALLMAECAAWAKSHGRTLDDELDRIFMSHGYHRERTANLYAYGASGREAIAGLVSRWREAAPPAFGGLRVVSVEDRMQPRATGSATRDLASNVLMFELAAPGGLACRLVVRPSGTEPKAKVYALGRGPASADAAGLARVRSEVDALVDRVIDDARALAEIVMGGGG
ncbi:MAG: phospho-sugar mutase [Deltaproteobacteria bacterium]|nr:phospho-sugar mutase [Nannocystaceae bacterium]